MATKSHKLDASRIDRLPSGNYTVWCKSHYIHEPIDPDVAKGWTTEPSRVNWTLEERLKQLEALGWTMPTNGDPDAKGNPDVIDEIVDEIASGNAHLMTRNELVEFLHWITVGEHSGEFSERIYNAMNYHGPIDKVLEDYFQELAKEWFVKKEYE